MRKRLLTLGTVFVLMATLTGCEKNEVVESSLVTDELTVPDIVGLEENIAKNVISSSGLIPLVEKEYSKDFEFGQVVRTDPEVGAAIEKNGKVTIYISDGAMTIRPKSSKVSYYNLTNERDDWEFSNIYVEGENLHVTCRPMFKFDVKWNTDGTARGFGHAQINDTLVPMWFAAGQTELKAGKRGMLVLTIPVTDLDDRKPTSVNLKLVAYINGAAEDLKYIEINLTMSW